MYDVIHVNRARRSAVLGTGLERQSAVDLARAEARRRRIGRMFLAGSESAPSEQILIVESARRAA